MRVIVLGGGIAGLAAAWALARRDAFEVTLFEREPQLFAHSSGKNAAIYRAVERQLPVAKLAVETASLLDRELGSRAAWLREDGLLLVAHERASLEDLAKIADAAGIDYEWIDRAALATRAPVIRDGNAQWALAVPGGGVLDAHAISTGLSKSVRAHGGSIVLARPARRVLVEGGRAVGVELETGERIDADRVVIAGGAWASALGETCGAPLPLTPVRRHLVVLEPDVALPPRAPTIWDAELQAYFRPESGGVLASPGDAEPWPAEDPPADTRALEMLWDKLRTIAPPLAGAKVRRSWACLRTFAPDKVSVAGADPRVEGLYWLAGLGGHGLTGGAAAGEVLAASVAGEAHPLARELSPARLV
jgi:D-arginine dehydrogenase